MSVNRYRLLRVAEYASVFASVVGAAVTLATRQLAFAIAPLSISVTLNLASRRQQQQRLEQHLTQTITQVNQRLERVSQQNKLLQQNLSALTHITQQQSADATTTDTTTEAEALQTLYNSLNQRIQSLSDEVQTIQHQLERQNQQMSTFADLSSFEQLSANLNQLETSLANLSNQTADALEHRLQTITQSQQQGFDQQQSDLGHSVTRLESDIAQIRSDLAGLRQEFEALIFQLRALSTTPEVRVPPAATEEVSTPSDQEPAYDFSQIVPQLPTDQNYDLEINLGIDFGTGFTKVCFRDLGRERAEIVTFADPEATQNGIALDQTLIPTKLAILQDETLLTGLTMAEWQAGNYPIRQSVDFIKMRLAHLDLPSESAWRLEHISELNDSATVESLCAYYLSHVIKRSQTWIHANRPDLFTNQAVRWSVNVGVPVEYCDSPALERFSRVLSLAWLLNYTPIDTSKLTIPTLNQLIAHLQCWIDENSIDNLDCNTTPEIAAAVWSFLSSREAQDGFYTFFDIGDGTLDGAAFRFWREDEGNLHVDFYKGKVEPLGVTAFTQQAAAELDSSPESIRQALTDSSNQDLIGKMQKSQVRRKVQQLVGAVVIQGNKKHQSVRRFLSTMTLAETLRCLSAAAVATPHFSNMQSSQPIAIFNRATPRFRLTKLGKSHPQKTYLSMALIQGNLTALQSPMVCVSPIGKGLKSACPARLKPTQHLYGKQSPGLTAMKTPKI